MSAADFAELRAYYDLEPFGEERDDLRAAIIAHTVAEHIWATGIISGPRPKLADFLPKFVEGGERRRQTPEEMAEIGKRLALAFGGEVKERRQ